MKYSPTLVALATALLAPAVVQAVEFGPTGPRSLGMGGSSVAIANDGLSALHNPAFLALAPRYRENEETGEEEMAGRYGLNVVDLNGQG